MFISARTQRRRSKARWSGKTRRQQLGIESLESRLVLDSTVVFNEIMYNPPEESDDGREWIELHNQLAVNMDISQWVLEGGVDYTFPDGTVVPGRGYLVVAADPVAFQQETGVAALGPFEGRLDNRGEQLRLFNNDGRLMNSIEYGAGGQWPTAPDGSGASLAKAHEKTASDVAANWTHSPEMGGTPGAANFVEPGAFIFEELLAEGATARALVPFDFDGSLGQNWIDPAFDDSSWTVGTTGVGYDNKRSETYTELLGLDLDAPPDGQPPIPLQNNNTSVYIRIPFQFNVDLLDADKFLLRMKYDDGFVAYLNGLEVAHENAPGRDGNNQSLGWSSTSTGSHSDAEAVRFVDFNISAFTDVFVPGENILAIHALNRRKSDVDLLIVPQIVAGREVIPDARIPVAINEVASGDEDNFWLEISNDGGDPIELGGFVLTATGDSGGQYIFPAQTLPGGGRLEITEQQLGFGAADGERLFLYSPGKAEVVDGRPVSGRLRGRSEQHEGRWLYPDTGTPGAANHFQFHDDVVINEVMFHAAPQQLRQSETPYIESDEEWIELVNRGTSPADLSGWTLRDAVTYEFPEGTTLGPGEYLVIANDAEALAAKYPTIDIAGEFSGGLSNHDDWIRLVDANKNPADEVHYYEGGRWPEFADGGRSSLELRDPDADNSKAEAWAASDESGKSQWQTYTFRGVSLPDVAGEAALFNEFIFGLLEAGEFLIDDIEVTEDPDGVAVPLIQNGTFEADTVGEAADKWRVIGTHRGTVIVDPEDPQNQVLHVVASGPQGYAHDHAETTFIDNRDVQDGTEYEFTFRAKWLAGSSQLNTRLFFSRAARTSLLDVPELIGTPGARNSTFEPNIGPTYAGFGHGPVTPEENETVTVSVQAQDADGVASMTLWWKADGANWNNVAMTAEAGRIYSGIIPEHSSGDVIQFYVEGQDGAGTVSTFPAAGPDSRALYHVADRAGSGKPNDIIDTLRLVWLAEDQLEVFPALSATNQMSNRFFPFTLVHNNRTFYDISVRQVGSSFVRPNSGYKVRMHPDNAFYGVHDSLRLDMAGLIEIAMKQMLSRAGGSNASMYDDLAYLISPQGSHTGTILLQLARYENNYLDEQFENGSTGTKFELDDVTYPTRPRRPRPEGMKTQTAVNSADMGINAQTVAEQGDNPEFYRGHILIKNQRTKDDYEPIVRMVQAIWLEGEELDAATQEVMDVDLFMRHYAHQSFLGNWDTYGFRRPKNIRFYVRPEDGKVIPLFWDCDGCNMTEPIIYDPDVEDVSRLDEIRDIPSNLRLFWGHMLDFINRSFNEEYITPWVQHFGELVGGDSRGGQITFDDFASVTGTRAAQALREMEDASLSGIPRVSFAITSDDTGNILIEDGMVTLAGTGWIDVRQIRLKDSDQPLEIKWTDKDAWEIQIPVSLGENVITLEAFDYQGNSINIDTITVSSTEGNPVANSLRITEINFNPHGPTSDELVIDSSLDSNDFEFIELQNVGTETINLLNVRFTDGIEFLFPTVLLGAGETGVLVKDFDAFGLRYGADVNVLGQFARGALNNGGERLTVVDALGQTVVDFQYSDGDPWPDRSDGVGGTLQLVDPANAGPETYGKYYSWRGSTEFGGSPGAEGAAAIGVVINEVLTNTDQADPSDTIELYNATGQPIDIGGWFLSDSSNNLLKYQIPAGTTIAPGQYVVLDEKDFNPTPANQGANHFALSGSRGDDVWLVIPDGAGGVQTFVDDVHFGAARSGESFGRTPNGHGRLAPMTSLTLGGENASPRVGPVVLGEVQYSPGPPSGAAVALYSELTSDDLEFVEIVNTSTEAEDLTDWRIRGGIDFDFSASTTLGPGQVALVVSFNPGASDNTNRINAFRTHYGLGESVMLIGGYQRQLSDTGERIQLQRPDAPPANDLSLVPRLLEDEVLYDNLTPWPTQAAGSGQSLTRTSLGGWGNAAQSWSAANPTPGTRETFVAQAGDSNMDGEFNQKDIVLVLQGGKYLTGETATFADGDWNGDSVFDQKDIVAALQTGNYLQGPNASLAKSDRNPYLFDSVFGELGRL